MIEVGVWAATGVCIAVSLSISFLGGRRYDTFWPKFFFFVVASLVGFVLFPFLSGLWQAAAPQQEHLIDPAFRKQAWTTATGVIAMAYVGAWRLQSIIDENRRS
jgi:hypothetical protein